MDKSVIYSRECDKKSNQLLFRSPKRQFKDNLRTPLVVPAPTTRDQSQARNVHLKSRFGCQPKYGADYLGAMAQTCHNASTDSTNRSVASRLQSELFWCQWDGVERPVASGWLLDVNTIFWHTMEESVCTLHSCLHGVHLVRVIADDVVHEKN